ncbi:hypothetical protein [Erwinia aphidicola]|uniref:hypothetical protein n=1 Tax=Erwinia aphidicola TaxID=68334 RepID=UPI003CE73C6C
MLHLTLRKKPVCTALSGLIADLMLLARHVGISDCEFAALVANYSLYVEAEQAELNGGKG